MDPKPIEEWRRKFPERIYANFTAIWVHGNREPLEERIEACGYLEAALHLHEYGEVPGENPMRQPSKNVLTLTSPLNKISVEQKSGKFQGGGKNLIISLLEQSPSTTMEKS